jgi:isovaleryl-CoA dehydrogenase
MTQLHGTRDLIGTPKLRALLEQTESIVRDVVAPLADSAEEPQRWPEPALRALQEAGIAGLNVPESSGGHGEGLLGLALMSELLAGECPSTALCFAMHCVGSAVLAAKATPGQARRYLEAIAAGTHLTTLAVSEPGSGAHFYVPESRLERHDGGFLLNGAKSFVTNGGRADSYVLSVSGPDAPAGGGRFSCVLLEAADANQRWGGEWDGLGMRGNSSRTVELAGVTLPADRLIGSEGDHLWYVFEVITPYFLMAMAGTYLGVANAALEIAREHLGQRRHSHTGELLGANPVLAHRLGELYIVVEQTRQLVYSAAQRGDAADRDALVAVFASKAAAGDAAVYVANEAMTLCGGIGYSRNGKLARLLRDARAAHVMSPTTDMLKGWVGRALLDLPLL